MHDLAQLLYVAAAALFITGIKQTTRPATARRGNRLGALGMAMAIAGVLIERGAAPTGWELGGAAAGAIVGLALAVRVKMTGMPQLVALLNGLGGAASAMVAVADAAGRLGADASLAERAVPDGAVAAAALIGVITLTGSLVAYAKLEGWRIADLRIPGAKPLNAALLALALGAAVGAAIAPTPTSLAIVCGLAAILGLTLVMPIGGADMPVVISLLNSYSGLAAAASGFAVGNMVLIVSGALVGASGLILTAVMCKAMNRSLTQAIFASGSAQAAAATAADGRLKMTDAEEVALLLRDARRVVVVPGYGMAVAQAQYAARDLYKALRASGAQAEFAIHPVAGRMPGHMNVLLAEADVPYEACVEMESINPTFGEVDVALVIGANDTVNPAAREAAGSPIAGMPILEVDRARTVVVIKRGGGRGFAGVDNPLFVADNTLMLLGDGKAALGEVVRAMSAN